MRLEDTVGKATSGVLRRRDVSRCVFILSLCSLIGFGFYMLGLSEANIITIYILGILVISSVTRHRVYGVFSSVAGVLLFNCLFAEPRFTLWVYDPQYTVTILIMLAASLTTSYIMGLFRMQLGREKLETRRSEILLETSQGLIQAGSEADIHRVAVQQLHQLRGEMALLFPVKETELLAPLMEAQTGKAPPLSLEEDRGVLAAWLRSGSGRDPLEREHGEHRAVYFKVQSHQTVFAVAGMLMRTELSVPTFEQNLMFAMLDEVALALERQRLHAFNERIAQQAEEERLRGNLLRTISHDLRTPLTSISGSADILLNSAEQIEPGRRRQIYQTIYDDSEWLKSLVENILFMTRMEDGSLSIRTEPELLRDIIPEVLHHMEKRLEEHPVTLALPDELLLVSLEARLFLHCVVNVLDNALKYTPPNTPIALRIFRRGPCAVLEVADRGGGIPDADKERVFDMFYTADKRSGDGRRGMGLGLFLCRSIMRAHGGEITLRDNTPTGTVVELSLPLEEVHDERDDSGD